MTPYEQSFIDLIAPLVQKYAPRYGIKIASPIIAQAILESGWGTSDLGQRNNFFGLKCRSNWKGKSYSKLTKEEYTPGQITTITDNFRVYDNPEQGVEGYFEFLFDPIAGGRYDNLKGVTNPDTYIELIKADGYCTTSNYVDQLKRIVRDYNLTQYDTIAGEDVGSLPKLFIIAGHGAGDPGAYGNGFNEDERVRALAKRIKELAPAGTVELGDFGRNYYADGGVSSLNVSRDTLVVELHMDSASSPAAKGAHVIIKSGYQPDWFDKALAERLAAYMPGRSSSIVARGDLANLNRAGARGINYRLTENGFITNGEDVAKFNDLDRMAKIYLDAAGIPYAGSEPEYEPAIPHNVVTADFNDGDEYQYWYILGEVKDGATIGLRNAGTSQWMSDPNSSQTPGTAVSCWPGQAGSREVDDPRDPQLWVVTKAKWRDSVFNLSPKVAPSLRLDTQYNEPQPNAQIQLYDANESTAQEFFFYRITSNLYRVVSCSGMKPLTLR